MEQRKNIILTGGGTGGHVFPGLALVYPLMSRLEISKEDITQVFTWMGSIFGPEKFFVESFGIYFKAVRTGKFRRYFSIKNISDIVNIFLGFIQARKFLKQEKRDLLITIGGFASLTTVLAAASLKIPIISVSCDLSLGLAAKITLPFASLNILSYEETATSVLSNSVYKKIFARKLKKLQCAKSAKLNNYIDSDSNIDNIDESIFVKSVGNPIRAEVYSGNADNINKRNDISPSDKVILFLGGSNGATQINSIVKDLLPKFSFDFCVVHQTGMRAYKVESNMVETNERTMRDIEYECKYIPFEFITEDYPDFLARADVIVARAGAGTIWEIIANEKPSILIPLSKEKSRGDQLENAKYFAEKHMIVNLGDNPSVDEVYTTIIDLVQDTELQLSLKTACAGFHAKESSRRIVEYIQKFL